ncbi:MarR family winged helix-turn-helix transcriptional regulator [Aliihoeflea sp. PC F10.4]
MAVLASDDQKYVGSISSDESPDLDVLGGTLSFFIRALDIAVSRDLDERLKGLEVAKGKGKITALLMIDSHPGIRPSEIAERIMKDRGHVTRIIDSFIAHDIVSRRTADDDNRAFELCVTEHGAALAAQVRKIVIEQEEAFFGPLIGKEDHDALVGTLQKIYLQLVPQAGRLCERF